MGREAGLVADLWTRLDGLARLQEMIAELDRQLRGTIDDIMKIEITCAVLSDIKSRVNQGQIIASRQLPLPGLSPPSQAESPN